jgi:hypothetical protein
MNLLEKFLVRSYVILNLLIYSFVPFASFVVNLCFVFRFPAGER